MKSGFLRGAGIDVPLALLAFAFMLAVIFQTVQLARESAGLVAIRHSQDAPLQEAQRLRQATDALASDVAELAQSGNANAKQVVEDMARQNVTLHAAPPPAK